MADFGELPTAAAWQHLEARAGFEVVLFTASGAGHRLDGVTTAVEDGQPWHVSYRIDTDAHGVTRAAHVTSRSRDGTRETRLERDGAGRWLRDGTAAAELDGCSDVDLEASAMTNALPVRRLRLPVGGSADAPAAYVRALDGAVERLEQSYTRLEDDGTAQRFDYVAPRFDVACVLPYDGTGLVTDYPGLAVRVPVTPG